MYPVLGTIAVSRESSIPLHTNTERGGAAGAQEGAPEARASQQAEHQVDCISQATLQAWGGGMQRSGNYWMVPGG